MRLLIIILLFPLLSYSQVQLSGKAVDKYSKKVVPYATIGLIKQNVGTSADEKGYFKISSAQPTHDSIIVSCVGTEG